MAFGGEEVVGAADFYLCRKWRWPPVTQLGVLGQHQGACSSQTEAGSGPK